MKFHKTPFLHLYIIEPQVLGDERGWFMRTFDSKLWEENIPGIATNWVQMNHSFNREKGTWRGFHFQTPPMQETKVVRCLAGAILDCVVDIRSGSETFMQVFTTELSAENKKQLYIPKGFAHGFYTLKANSEVLYLHDEYYNPYYEQGIRVDDPAINFPQRLDIKQRSIRDQNHPLLSDTFKGY